MFYILVCRELSMATWLIVQPWLQPLLKENVLALLNYASTIRTLFPAAALSPQLLFFKHDLL